MDPSMPMDQAELQRKMLIDDISLIERMRARNLERQRMIEQKLRDDEEEYLENSLSRYGTVFNGWSQIKTGANSNPNQFDNTNKRVRKMQDKEKDKERIYSCNEEKYHKRGHDPVKIDFMAMALKFSDPRHKHVSTRSSKKPMFDSANSSSLVGKEAGSKASQVMSSGLKKQQSEKGVKNSKEASVQGDKSNAGNSALQQGKKMRQSKRITNA